MDKKLNYKLYKSGKVLITALMIASIVLPSALSGNVLTASADSKATQSKSAYGNDVMNHQALLDVLVC